MDKRHQVDYIIEQFNSETSNIEYSIQRKTSTDTDWNCYTRHTFKLLDQAVEMLNYFRKTSNNMQFRLVKKTNTVTVEPV